jgi:hypothetical protein
MTAWVVVDEAGRVARDGPTRQPLGFTSKERAERWIAELPETVEGVLLLAFGVEGELTARALVTVRVR